MEKRQIVELMFFVKGIWQDQATDDPTVMAWVEVLGETMVSTAMIKEAVLRRARAGLDRPHPGQIYNEATLIEAEEAQRVRYSRKALPEPQPSPEERSRMRELLRNLVNKLSVE